MRRAAVLVALLALAAVPVLAGEGDAVVGVWATELGTEDGGAHIQVYQKDGKYFGKIIWLEKPVYPADDDQGMAGQEKVDRENPEESLRQRPVIGLEMMFDFEYAGDGKWKGGTIYAPDEGKTYKCKMTLEGNDSLRVRGFIGISLLCRNEDWTRVKDAS
jgi:uncharacterized protein (DUF2147 family)